MKILFLLTRCDQTGMTTHTLDLGTALVNLGQEVTLLLGRSKCGKEKTDCTYSLFQKFLNSGMDVVLYREPTGSLLSKAKSFLSVISYILRHNFDVIHVQSPYLSFIPWLLHKTFVSTMHVNDIVPCLYYKNATHLIAISNETKEYAKRVFGYKEEQITIVNHGVSLSFAEPITPQKREEERMKRGLPTDKIIIGLVGSVERRKGHDLLLQAVAQLPQECRERVHIVFLGSSKDGKTNQWLDDEIAKSGLQGSVTRFEYQPPQLFYKLFDIFCLPSRLEGFGLVVIEAMLSGCCCVRSNTEESYEQIEDGKSGFLFENENVSQLSAILRRLITTPNLIPSIACQGRQVALKKFTSRSMAENTLKVYEKVKPSSRI